MDALQAVRAQQRQQDPGTACKVQPHGDSLAKVVEMRYFGGYTEQEIADALDLTERTVRRDWDKARLLLGAMLKG